jgi:hypothetical protein
MENLVAITAAEFRGRFMDSMQALPRSWRAVAWLSAMALLPILGGCTFHRNLLLRWHMEFDADSISDCEVPCSADDCKCHYKPSKLGRPPAGEPTPAELGRARFFPVPTKPVFPAPSNDDMADMGPPAPESYLKQHEPLRQPGRIMEIPSIPDGDLEEVGTPMPLDAPLPPRNR